jgi:hypothetical protein
LASGFSPNFSVPTFGFRETSRFRRPVFVELFGSGIRLSAKLFGLGVRLSAKLFGSGVRLFAGFGKLHN